MAENFRPMLPPRVRECACVSVVVCPVNSMAQDGASFEACAGVDLDVSREAMGGVHNDVDFATMAGELRGHEWSAQPRELRDSGRGARRLGGPSPWAM